MPGSDKDATQGSIIAEIGSVHDGSFGNATKLIEAAATCGADTVKFQTHIAEAETLRDAPAPSYFSAEPRFDYFRRTGFDIDEWRDLKACAVANNVRFLSSPFSLEAVDLLQDVGVDAFKIASGEVTNTPLLERIAETGKPALLSSGMSNWSELDTAMAALKPGGPVTVMQCSSIYPCPPEQVGLNVITEMADRYGTPVGFSDHTNDMAAGIAAAALGATAIEKHFTFSRLMYGSDAANAMEPDAFTTYAGSIRSVWSMLSNDVDKSDIRAYADMKKIFEKSVVSAAPLNAGTTLERRHLAFKKPGSGIRAADYTSLVGRRLRRDVPADYLFSQDDLS